MLFYDLPCCGCIFEVDVTIFTTEHWVAGIQPSLGFEELKLILTPTTEKKLIKRYMAFIEACMFKIKKLTVICKNDTEDFECPDIL